MVKDLLARFCRDPLGTVKRAFYKLFVATVKYRRGGGYDARGYWTDRFAKYGMSLRGAGDEGLSEEANRKAYEAARQKFLTVCEGEGVDFENVSVLEIGVGGGFYTSVLRQAGVKRYHGLDITDVLFPKLREEYPDYRFTRKDITTEQIDGTYDLIVMMDVVEHIVEEAKLSAAMRTIKMSLSEKGVIVISGVREKKKRYLFYVQAWRPQDILKYFSGYTHTGPIPFRTNNLLVIRKTETELHQ